MQKWLGLFAVIMLGVPLLFYGTLSPCGMLRHEIRRSWLEKMFSEIQDKSNFGTLGAALGIGLGGVFLDRMIGALSPFECLKALAKLKVRGEDIFEYQARTRKEMIEIVRQSEKDLADDIKRLKAMTK